MVLVNMTRTFSPYKHDGRGIETKRFVCFVLLFVFLSSGKLPLLYDDCAMLVGAFSLIQSFSSSPSPLRIQSAKQTSFDDACLSANATVQYSDLVKFISEADYMDDETRKRLLWSLRVQFSDPEKGIEDTGSMDTHGSSCVVATTNTTINTKLGNKKIPTIEGLWMDDGGPFHATGAWQNTPLLMKGAFYDAINNIENEESHPFPTWKEIIELACDSTPKHENDVFYMEENDENDNDQYDDIDGETYEDGNEDFDFWGAENQFYGEEDTNDNPPSRLIQYSWPRKRDSKYYHADVNTNWLDTFEINQFGPFDDPESLEALLKAENEDTSTRCVARTLLVNDVDRWFPKLSDWMDRRFNNNNSTSCVLPARWRRDDAQISLSHPLGGIGPHVDDYDVFLIQLEGERTWDVFWEDTECDQDELKSGVKDCSTSKVTVRDEADCILPESSTNGVRILNVTKLQSLQHNRFGKLRSKLIRLHLRPGDCLYLPPRVLHCGTAVDASENCMTLSVGCRAPSALELIDGLSTMMQKSSATVTSPTAAFPSTAAIQAFHRRYTNTEIGGDAYRGEKSLSKMSPLLPQSSWLSPQVKSDMKHLILTAVQSALEDDTNILDPLIGRFVTKSNRLEEAEFELGEFDDSPLPSFSYPKALRDFEHEEHQGESDEFGRDKWVNTSTVLTEVFGTQSSNEQQSCPCLRRAEGIAFAWSSVYDKEAQIQKYRLYAQGRPAFEVFDHPIEISSSAPSSAIGRLLDRIANGPPLDRFFVVDELQISLDVTKKATKYSAARLLYDLVEEGLLYGVCCSPGES